MVFGYQRESQEEGLGNFSSSALKGVSPKLGDELWVGLVIVDSDYYKSMWTVRVEF